MLGVVFGAASIVIASVFGIWCPMGGDVPLGWTSLICVILLGAGTILFALGAISAYLGAAVNMPMGRPRPISS